MSFRACAHNGAKPDGEGGGEARLMRIHACARDGERIAQLMITNCFAYPFEESDELSDTARQRGEGKINNLNATAKSQ